MSTRLQIPKSANLARIHTITLPEAADCTYSGWACTMRLWRGYASAGYRTNYERVPAAWLEITRIAPNHRARARQAWKFSGKRLALADKHYEHNLKAMGELDAEYRAQQAGKAVA